MTNDIVTLPHTRPPRNLNYIVTKDYIKRSIDNEIFMRLDEPELQSFVSDKLKNHFIVKPQVKGYHLLEQHKVIIDFLLYPKQKLIDSGFDPKWFGCEVKSPNVKQEASKRILNLGKQCIDYTETKFDDNIIPNFVVMFPSIPHFFHAQGALNDEVHSFLYWFKPFLQRFKVGTLHIYSKSNWAINFGHGRYFSTKKGKGNVPNFGTKRKIGSV